MEPILKNEKEYLNLFRISLYIKGINGIVEVLGGILVWFVSKVFLVTFILNFFQNELSDDPKDYVANFIVNTAASLSVGSQYFLGAYLFLHGIIKIFLIIGLLNKKIWVYPIAIFIFSVFMVYQTYLYSLSHSPWILALTLLDLLIVFLTVHEYRVLKKKLKYQ